MDSDSPVKANKSEIAFFNEYIGQKCAFLCCRYQYRGILSELILDGRGNLASIVLANATSVEVTGPANADQPNTEDAIHTSITIKNDAWEIFYQPNWCYAPLPNEEGAESTDEQAS